MFGAEIKFNHGPGISSIQTVMGATLSLCANLFALVFLVQSLIIWLQYKGTLYTTSFEVGYFDGEEIYTQDDHGIQFAIGVIDLQYRTGQEESEYSLEQLYHITVNNLQLSVGGLAENVEFELHECTEEELGIVEDDATNSRFFKPFPLDYKLAIETYKHRILCFDHSALKLK